MDHGARDGLNGKGSALSPSHAGICGLRIGEAFGLRWCDVYFESDVLQVRQQLSRRRTPKHLKTEAGRREVVSPLP